MLWFVRTWFNDDGTRRSPVALDACAGNPASRDAVSFRQKQRGKKIPERLPNPWLVMSGEEGAKKWTEHTQTHTNTVRRLAKGNEPKSVDRGNALSSIWLHLRDKAKGALESLGSGGGATAATVSDTPSGEAIPEIDKRRPLTVVSCQAGPFTRS